MPTCEATDVECSAQLVPKSPIINGLCGQCYRRIKAWQYSVRGWGLLLSDCSVQFLLAFCALVLIMAHAKLRENWCSLSVSILLAISLEGANSVIELLCDYIQPEQSEAIRDIKDMSAALAAVGPIIVVLVFTNSMVK